MCVAHVRKLKIGYIFLYYNFSVRIWNYLDGEWEHADRLLFLTKRRFDYPFFHRSSNPDSMAYLEAKK
jgi:hypothetical protein